MAYYKFLGHAKELLYHYPENRRLLKRIEEDVLLGQTSDYDHCYRRGGVSNPTYRKAVLLSEGRLAEMRREVAAVEKLLSQIETFGREDVRARRLLEMVYFRMSHTLYGAAIQLQISEATAKRWNQKILLALAEIMHWI